MTGSGWSRRAALAHCSLLALGAALAGAMPAAALGAASAGGASNAGSAGSTSNAAGAAGAGSTSNAGGVGSAGGAGGAGGAARPERVILVVGDSLSAEYGLARGAGWVALLEKRLAERRLPARVVNASVSGDTTSGGRSRLPALLAQYKPTHVVIELGGNDALRGLPLNMTRDNLAEMARAAQAAGAQVVLVGMQVPPNYGQRYAQDFAQLFVRVAKDQGAALVPFLLQGVADVPESERLFQADRIHPREAAHPKMLDNVWRVLGPLLR